MVPSGKPRSYWGQLATLAGIAALFTAFGTGLTLGALNYPQQERYQSYRYASDKPLEIEIVATGKADAKALEYRAPCSQPKGRDESDLCAQWKAARAAERGTLWAQIGVIVTAFGILGLLTTIAQSHFALRKASEANSIAQDAASYQLRAYVGPIGACIHPPYSHVVKATIDFQNFGQTPAKNVSVKAALMWAAEEMANCPKFDIEQYIGIIDPGQVCNITIVLNKPICSCIDEFAEKVDLGNRVSVFFDVSYDTLFSKGHFRRIVYYLDTGTVQSENKWMLSVSKSGHESD